MSVSAGRLRQTGPRNVLVRFVYGGLVTVAAGLIAIRFGPVVGGLFLAFPAILPASLTLLTQQARNTAPAGADAYGAIMGSVGLLVFGVLVWGLATLAPAWLALALALLAWIITACGTWTVVERLRCARRERAHRHAAPVRRPMDG